MHRYCMFACTHTLSWCLLAAEQVPAVPYPHPHRLPPPTPTHTAGQHHRLSSAESLNICALTESVVSSSQCKRNENHDLKRRLLTNIPQTSRSLRPGLASRCLLLPAATLVAGSALGHLPLLVSQCGQADRHRHQLLTRLQLLQRSGEVASRQAAASQTGRQGCTAAAAGSPPRWADHLTMHPAGFNRV